MVGTVAGRVVETVHCVANHLVAVGVGVEVGETHGYVGSRIDKLSEEFIAVFEHCLECPCRCGVRASGHRRERTFNITRCIAILVVIFLVRRVVLVGRELYAEVA